MRAELPTTSFLCAASLILLALAQRKVLPFATLSLICWLLVVNLIHGVNASLWASDLDVHSAIWCDMATKITLGASFAFPATTLSILYHLKSISASPNSYDATSKPRYRYAFDFILCIILPLCYMALHCIVQDRRFVIVADMGCISAVHPSIVSIIMLWLPLLFICITALILLSITLHNTWRRRHILASGLANTAMAAPEYHRLLVCGTALSILLSTYVVFMTSVSGARGLQAWTSWADVHRRMSEVEVVRSEDMLTLDETKVEMEWWIVPMLSLFVFGLLGFGRGTRAGYHDLVDATVGRLSQTRCRGSSVLPIHREQIGTSSVSSKSRLMPGQSGWDDTSDSKFFPIFFSPPSPTAKPHTLRIDIPTALKSRSSPVLSAADSDTSFAASTVEYLGSPTGRRALTRAPPSPLLLPPTPVPSPSPSPAPHTRPASHVSSRPPSQVWPPSHISTASLAPRKASDGALSTVSAISESLLAPSAWPEPPSAWPGPLRTVPPSPVSRDELCPAGAPPLSPAPFSTAHVQPTADLCFPFGPFDAPLAKRVECNANGRPAVSVVLPQRALTPKRSFRYARSDRQKRDAFARGEGVHMTVVKEVV